MPRSGSSPDGWAVEDGSLTLAPQCGLWCGAPARHAEVGPPWGLSVQVSVHDTLIRLLCGVLWARLQQDCFCCP